MDNLLNIENIPREVRLILNLIKADSSKGFSQYKTSDLDWDLFLRYVMHHRLHPRLHLKCKEEKIQFIPSYIKDQLMHLYRRNTLLMLQLSGEMELVSRLFAKKDIDTIFLKGPVVAQDLYGSISHRTSGDLDFLIPMEKLDEAETILVEQGYEKDDYIETVLNDWKWRHHHVTYYHPLKQMKLEIHWRLHPGPGKETSFHDLWKRKRVSSITQFPVYYLGCEDLFHFLVVHGARHGWSRLRWLDDIQQILKQPLNWELITSLFKQNYQTQMAGQAILLANQLLGVSLSIEMNQFIKRNRPYRLAQEAIFYLEQMVNLHNNPLPKDVAVHHQRHVIHLMSIQQKLGYFLSLMHPFPEDVALLPLPKKMHLLYYPLRPLLWAWRKIRKPVLF